MNKLFLTLIFSIMVFVIGCQDNSITDPEASGTINKVASFGEINNPNVILLKEELKNPDPKAKSNYYLNGVIEHKLDFNSTVGADPVNKEFDGTLSLSVSASLSESLTSWEQDFNIQNEWKISAKSFDKVRLSTNNESKIEKSFKIEGREDGLVLVCSFVFTPSGVSLSSVYVKLPTSVDPHESVSF